MASKARTVFASIKPGERLVNEPQFFFLPRDQSGVHFDVSARARHIDLVRRKRLGLLFLSAPQLFDFRVSLVAKPYKHAFQHLVALGTDTFSFPCHISRLVYQNEYQLD